MNGRLRKQLIPNPVHSSAVSSICSKSHNSSLSRIRSIEILTYFVTEKCSKACKFCSRHSQKVIGIPTCSAGALLSNGVKIISQLQFLPLLRGPIRRIVPSQNGALSRTSILLGALSQRLRGVERIDGTRLLVSLGTWIRVDYFVNLIDQFVNLTDFHGFQPIWQRNRPILTGIFAHIKVQMIFFLMCRCEVHRSIVNPIDRAN